MNITHNNVVYVLDVNKAISLNAMKPVVTHKVEFTEDEVHALMAILQHVGGHPDNARGCTDSVYCKLRDLNLVSKKSSHDLTISKERYAIYFKK